MDGEEHLPKLLPNYITMVELCCLPECVCVCACVCERERVRVSEGFGCLGERIASVSVCVREREWVW